MNIIPPFVLLDNDPPKRGKYFNITCCQFQLFLAEISYDVSNYFVHRFRMTFFSWGPGG